LIEIFRNTYVNTKIKYNKRKLILSFESPLFRWLVVSTDIFIRPQRISSSETAQFTKAVCQQSCSGWHSAARNVNIVQVTAIISVHNINRQLYHVHVNSNGKDKTN